MPFFLKNAGILVMVYRCACGLDIILRLFCHFFSEVELSHFWGVFFYHSE